MIGVYDDWRISCFNSLAYCSRNISTIALLDWTQLQPEKISLTVTNWTSAIGRIVASTFDTLKIKGYNVETWHLIGHSMGAHIAGCIGTYTNFSWLHITGMLCKRRFTLPPSTDIFFYFLNYLYNIDERVKNICAYSCCELEYYTVYCDECRFRSRGCCLLYWHVQGLSN